MSEYPKIIERPFKVFVGEVEYVDCFSKGRVRADITWSYRRSFRMETDAEAYAERESEDYEFVKIEKKETE